MTGKETEGGYAVGKKKCWIKVQLTEWGVDLSQYHGCSERRWFLRVLNNCWQYWEWGSQLEWNLVIAEKRYLRSNVEWLNSSRGEARGDIEKSCMKIMGEGIPCTERSRQFSQIGRRGSKYSTKKAGLDVVIGNDGSSGESLLRVGSRT